ncbi:hypothetical protein FOXYSP1_06799 [Fusarium oxysporum f. sp. phaseoli]
MSSAISVIGPMPEVTPGIDKIHDRASSSKQICTSKQGTSAFTNKVAMFSVYPDQDAKQGPFVSFAEP